MNDTEPIFKELALYHNRKHKGSWEKCEYCHNAIQSLLSGENAVKINFLFSWKTRPKVKSGRKIKGFPT